MKGVLIDRNGPSTAVFLPSLQHAIVTLIRKRNFDWKYRSGQTSLSVVKGELHHCIGWNRDKEQFELLDTVAHDGSPWKVKARRVLCLLPSQLSG